MPFIIEITADSYADLQKQVLSLAAGMRGAADSAVSAAVINADSEPAPKPAPKKTPPKTKAEPEAKPEPEAKAEPETVADATVKASYSELSADEFSNVVRDVVIAVVTKRGRPHMQNILSGYGIERASLAQPEQRDELVRELQAALD